MKQLTKSQLQNLRIKDKISETTLGVTSTWEVTSISISKLFPLYDLTETKTKKKSHLLVGNNFNKEGDRKYKSSRGNLTIKYYDGF